MSNHVLKHGLPVHRQLRALTLAPDGTIHSDNSTTDKALTVGDLRQIIYALERAYQTIGEMTVETKL